MKTRTIKVNSTSVAITLLICICIFLVGTGVQAGHSMTQSGNEFNALQFVSSFRLLQQKYASEHSGQFATSYTKLGEFEKVCEERECRKIILGEYTFTIKVNKADSSKPAFYSINADPIIRYGLVPMGTRHFHFDSTLNSIKCTEENRPATADDPAI